MSRAAIAPAEGLCKKQQSLLDVTKRLMIASQARASHVVRTNLSIDKFGSYRRRFEQTNT